MKTHEVVLSENRSLSLVLSEGWIPSTWQGMKGVFYQTVKPGFFAPNVTIAANPIEEPPTLEELRDQLVATYDHALGHKLLGVEVITMFNTPGVRLESVVIAGNGFRVVQTVRAGIIQISEEETMQIEIAGSCTQKQAGDYLPELRSSLRLTKLVERVDSPHFETPTITATTKTIDSVRSVAPRRFPSPKRLEALPPLKLK